MELGKGAIKEVMGIVREASFCQIVWKSNSNYPMVALALTGRHGMSGELGLSGPLRFRFVQVIFIFYFLAQFLSICGGPTSIFTTF